jgi:hypothetical protein
MTTRLPTITNSRKKATTMKKMLLTINRRNTTSNKTLTSPTAKFTRDKTKMATLKMPKEVISTPPFNKRPRVREKKRKVKNTTMKRSMNKTSMKPSKRVN